MDKYEKHQHIEQTKEGITPEHMHAEEIIAHHTASKKFRLGKSTIIIIILVAVIAGLVGLKTYQQLKPVVKQVTVNRQVLQKRSKSLGYVNRALTGKAIDIATGKVVQAARIFTPDDKKIYLEVDLNQAQKGTIIDCLRYKNGKYVDLTEVTLQNGDIKNILFNWIITKLLSANRDGSWRVNVYAKGILEKRILYEIKDNKVSYVYPDQPVSTNDSDYRLPSVTH